MPFVFDSLLKYASDYDMLPICLASFLHLVLFNDLTSSRIIFRRPRFQQSSQFLFKKEARNALIIKNSVFKERFK